MERRIYILILLLIFSKLAYNQNDTTIVEFRGVWVATNKMLDYPSKRGLTSEQLKEEFIALLKMHKENGLNAIIFQIRPASDAFYDSPYEPFSEWLTGKQGRDPEPYFDPLEFMIEETHKMGMEFHAWFNPFRSVATIEYADICSNHISKTKPEWNFTYGLNKYLNPGIPEVREYVTKIIADVVTRYDIDGVHFDDYFYPYPEKDSANQIIAIPDYSTYTKYKDGFLDIKDWRRNNMDMFVKMVHDTIKSIKPDVVFGVSPPGVWRNKGYDPEGSNTLGLACYDYLYADILNWLKNDWIDYVAPQIYWYIGNPKADFAHLVDWWSSHNYDKDLYIGIGAYNISSTGNKSQWGSASQVPDQIRLARKNPDVKGFIFYKTQTFRENPLGLNDSLRNNLFLVAAYAHKPKIEIVDTTVIAEIIENDSSEVALVPEKVDLQKPENLDKYKIKNEFTIYWDKTSETGNNLKYNVYKSENKNVDISKTNNLFVTVSTNKVVVKRDKNLVLFGQKYYFVITAVDEFGNESKVSKNVMIKF